MQLLSSLAFASAVSATAITGINPLIPIPTTSALAKRGTTTGLPAICTPVSSIINLLKVSSATPFCSSFLGIKTSTKTVTVTSTLSIPSTAVVLTTSTSTVHVTSTLDTTVSTSTTLGPLSISTDNEVYVVTATATVTASAGGEVEIPEERKKLKKRATTLKTSTKTACATPTILKNLVSSKISTICGCLGLPTPTSTTTVVVRSTITYNAATLRSTIVPQSTVTDMVYNSVTAIVTSVPLSTSTAYPTTSTTTITTTVLNTPQIAVCSGFYSSARCCSTDVLGIADLDCVSPTTTPTGNQNFIDICSAQGQRAVCCLGQAVLCSNPVLAA
ncbi:hypothetical protein LTR17_019848 [Elasticomyces elasticus]|nr:hypothetical protein LTR17_019848 [Elasticomyces elasticus]